MAFCGISFTDEKKEYTEANIHSLKNVIGFSTVQKRFSCCNPSEGLLETDDQGVRNDRREKIDFRVEKFKINSFALLSQVVASVRHGTRCVGTSTRIQKENGTMWVLTCAHNLVTKSIRTGHFHRHKDAYAYERRQGEKAWLQLYKLDPKNMRTHPKYNGESTCGFDIATGAYSEVSHEYNGQSKYSGIKSDCFWAGADPKNIKVGYKIELSGYPAEKDGWPYFHSGEITHIKKTDEGGWVLFYNIDSTPGMSGSPIMIVDERFLSRRLSEKRRRDGIKKIMIGVHTGHDAAEGLNFGTLITPALQDWIEK